MAGKLVQIAADLAALSQQVREKFQCIFSAAGDNNGLLDGLTKQGTANEGGHIDAEKFAEEFQFQLLLFCDPELDELGFPRCAAVLGVVSSRTNARVYLRSRLICAKWRK